MRNIIILFFITFIASAQEIHFAKDYETAVVQAKKENKLVMVLITTETCKWCRKLEATTLKDPAVIARINAEFVPVHVTRNKDSYPEYLSAQVVPKSYFLYPDGSLVMRGTMGYWIAEDYLSILDDVMYKVKKHQQMNTLNK